MKKINEFLPYVFMAGAAVFLAAMCVTLVQVY
jgi:hypothetical protein